MLDSRYRQQCCVKVAHTVVLTATHTVVLITTRPSLGQELSWVKTVIGYITALDSSCTGILRLLVQPWNAMKNGSEGVKVACRGYLGWLSVLAWIDGPDNYSTKVYGIHRVMEWKRGRNIDNTV